MIRSVSLAIAVLSFNVCIAAENEISVSQQGASAAASDQTATIRLSGGTQTFDPFSAFDGYWFPDRAIDGQEDR